MADDAPTFNEIDWDRQAENDAAEMAKVVAGAGREDGDQTLFDPDRPLGVDEDKADTAIDYEDFDSDDLPEEEPSQNPDGDLPGLTDDQGTSHETDDLFGEGRGSSPLFGDDDDDDDEDLFGEGADANDEAQPAEPEVDLLAVNFPERFPTSNQDPSIPAPAESGEELINLLWPEFVQGITLSFNELLPVKKAHFIPKAPLKLPKPLAPTKVSLDLAPDTEKLFKSAAPVQSNKRKRILEAEARGLVAIIEESSAEESEEDDFDFSTPPPDEHMDSMYAKLEMACANFDPFEPPEVVEDDVVEDEPMDDWDKEFLGHSSKQRKSAQKEPDVFNIPRYGVPSFDNFEQDTARIAQRVILDENDPHLLLERIEPEVEQTAKRQRITTTGGFAKRGGGLNASLKSRFNYSNDEAYDALKENHANKVRGLIGHEAVEHSMPALRLQWPYYKTRLTAREARSMHRPMMGFKDFMYRDIQFSLPGLRKKKQVAGMPVETLFNECKDLSLYDHYSTATLFEYCEEHPMVLSNFGMGNRIINYYRRMNVEDSHRPAPEDKLGDLHVLLPEDKSPFAKFGMVEPGETIRSIHNGMFRAPIFKQPVKNSDFLIVRSTTGANGTQWHLRNIDNLFVVGQQYPAMEIPGPSSRKHTNVAKHRLRMLVNRIIKHTPTRSVRTSQITAHVPGSTDSQNRQKLKEFTLYDKIDKTYKMKTGEEVPDEATIRSWIKPEDVCGVDAMQVGCQHLKDSGHHVPGLEGDEPEKVDKVKYDDKTLEEKLAPWTASKAFSDACEDKAMLQLHGEGDPTGCGLGISLVKISMKGGYQGGPNATSDAAMTAAEKKANGGHSYNVKKQEAAYQTAIHDIWNKQKENLTNTIEPDHDDMDIDEADHGAQNGVDDDATSQTSNGGRSLRIVRKPHPNAYGQVDDDIVEYVTDPRVIKAYLKRVYTRDHLNNVDVFNLKSTGNATMDELAKKKAVKELARLERNKERRLAREKQKLQAANGGILPDSFVDAEAANSPAPTPSTERPTGTSRKCANCGQTGHIKTNKKLCPLLNGSQGPVDSSASKGGFGAITAPSFNS